MNNDAKLNLFIMRNQIDNNSNDKKKEKDNKIKESNYKKCNNNFKTIVNTDSHTHTHIYTYNIRTNKQKNFYFFNFFTSIIFKNFNTTKSKQTNTITNKTTLNKK